MKLALMSTVFVWMMMWLSPAAAGESSTQPAAYIARFPGDRAAAISYTFDDNLRDQFTVAAPMLDEVGFKATFFVIAGKTAATPEEGERKREDGNPRNLWGGISWPELKRLALNGHEIASHTWSHRALTKLPRQEIEDEFIRAIDAIKLHIGVAPATVAFPGNSSNELVREVALQHHLAFRERQQSTSGKSTVESLNAWADRLVEDRKAGVLMLHGIERGYAALTDPQILRDHLRYVRGLQDRIWVDTFANVCRYEKERDAASLDVHLDSSRARLVLTSSLEGNGSRQPVTIVLRVSGAAHAAAFQAGRSMPVECRSDALMISATPDKEAIEITWTR